VKKFCTFVALVALLAFQATTNAATMEERIAAAGAAMALDSADKPAESSPQAEASLSWDMTRAKAVPYAVVQAQKEHRAAIGRTKLLLRIVPVAKGKDGKLQPLHGQNKLTKEQLAATAAAAAKYHAQLTGAQMVSVALQTQFFPNHGAARLATVDYAPDGKGVSGKDNWRWHMFSAAEAGPTDAALKTEKPGALYLPMEQAPVELADAVPGSAPLK
jgi:hypothetical protein